MQSQSQKGEITILYNDTIENYSIISLDEKYTNRKNFEIKVYNFLKCKEYHMTLFDSHPINSNFRFFNLSDRLVHYKLEIIESTGDNL